jgi:hypothetical protein
MFKKIISTIFFFLLAVYLLIVSYFYFKQETIIFNPHTVAKDSVYQFNRNFTESWFTLRDGVKLNVATFHPDSRIGFIFYLHGNYYGLSDTHRQADLLVDLGYTVFMPDYRGFAKSEGTIESEAQFLADVDELYQFALESNADTAIVIVGYSLGTAPASYLAAKYSPKKLILKAPYYSMPFMLESLYPFLPSFLLNYQLRNDAYLPNIVAPVAIIHGDLDDIIPIESSYKLKTLFKAADTLIVLKNEDHLELDENPDYRRVMSELLR